MLLARIVTSFGKILFASLITGTVLAALGITTDDIFPGAKPFLDQMTDMLELALNWLIIWSIPNILVGAIVIIPIWIILVAFGPKGK
ncbi:MAG: hypothetical protein N4A65_03110 [Cohaesibacter sp.]|nr:hypothetical protein [Cohaesibacter sp.]